jgi:hypothetical protein
MAQNNHGAAGEAAGAVAGGRQQNPAVVKAYWRKTRMGGVTYPIALRLEGNKLRVLEPIWEEYSKTHSHGMWYYPQADVDMLIYLEQSNSGKRSAYVSMCRLTPQQCKAVEEAVQGMWSTATTREVEKMLEVLELTA